MIEKSDKGLEKWETYAQRGHLYDSVLPIALREILRDSNKPVRALIDMGCGDGALLLALKDQGLLSERQACGVDLSQTRLDRLRQMCPEILTVQASVDQTNLQSHFFDLVISTQVIEHVLDPTLMIQEMARLLKTGGALYLSTVFKHRYAWYFHRCQGQWVLDPTHLREYRHESELIPELEVQGFRIRSQSLEPISYPLIDPILRRWNFHPAQMGWGAFLRQLKIPIPGYFNWEIIAEKK